MEQTSASFTLEHARKLAVLRAYVLYIERRTSALVLGEEGDTRFGEIKTLLDSLVEQLRAMRIREQGLGPHGRCPPDYAECDDGSCDVSCPSS